MARSKPVLLLVGIAVLLSLPGGPAGASLTAAWWRADGPAAGDFFGRVVAGVPDVDGDGRGEVVIGAPGTDAAGRPDAGAVYLCSGADGHVLWVAHGDTAGDRFGNAVAGVEDLDHDGSGDVIVGASRDDPLGRTDAGTVYVFSGGTGALLWSAHGTTGDLLGFSVAGVPDADGDGVADVVVGATEDDPLGVSGGGTATLYSGATGALRWQRGGTAFNDHLGSSLAGIPDVDGDGRGDVVVGAPEDDVDGRTNAGSVLLLSGATGAVRWQRSGDTASDRLGCSVAGAPGLSGPGTVGVVAGASSDDPAGRVDAGSVQAFDAATGALLWTTGGAATRDLFGSAVAAGFDVNQDGYGDVAVGAPQTSPPSGTGAGAAYVLSGRDGTFLWTSGGTAFGDAFGESLATVGDVDGDLRGDLVVGAGSADPGARGNAGSAFLFATDAAPADVTPPTILCPQDLVLEAAGPEGAPAAFEGIAHDDVDPSPVVVSDLPSGTVFPLGSTTVTCTATDAAGNEASCQFRVVVQDTTAPSVACSTEVSSLWSPNHTLRDVGLDWAASDAVSPDLRVTVAVHSDEAAAAEAGDAEVSGRQLRLRCARSATGDGRVFLVVVTASDAAGNTNRSVATVVVPHDRSAAARRAVEAEAAAAAEEAAGGIPAGYVTLLAETDLP